MINIRTPSGRSYASNLIAKELGRGNAIADKINTVLNDLRGETNLKVLDKISEEHVSQLVNNYLERVENGNLSEKTAVDYISALNSTLKVIGKDELTISASELGLSKESHIHNQEFKGINQETVNEFKEYLNDKAQEGLNYQALEISVELMEQFGLRWREAVSIKILDKDIESNSLVLTAEDGTKNGREREIPITTEEQREVLAKAQEFAKEQGWYSLINPEMTRAEWRSFSYNTLKEFNSGREEQLNFHALRHNYANERYQQLKSEGLSESDARLQVSEELGHGREEVTYAYIPGGG